MTHHTMTAAREARCLCLQTVPSRPDLAFFQPRGPGSKIAAKTCLHCGYYEEAHTPETMARNRSLTCATFAASEGHEFDSYYCGCRGWD